MLDDERCQATVFKPEQLRRTGRGKHGFERHYIKTRCARVKEKGSDYCWQHRYKMNLLLDCPRVDPTNQKSLGQEIKNPRQKLGSAYVGSTRL